MKRRYVCMMRLATLHVEQKYRQKTTHGKREKILNEAYFEVIEHRRSFARKTHPIIPGVQNCAAIYQCHEHRCSSTRVKESPLVQRSFRVHDSCLRCMRSIYSIARRTVCLLAYTHPCELFALCVCAMLRCVWVNVLLLVFSCVQYCIDVDLNVV